MLLERTDLFRISFKSSFFLFLSLFSITGQIYSFLKLPSHFDDFASRRRDFFYFGY